MRSPAAKRDETPLEHVGPTTFRAHLDELEMRADLKDIIEFAVGSVGRVTPSAAQSGAYRYHRVE